MKQYNILMEDENLIDFSSIQTEAYKLLIEEPSILEEIQQKIKYVMVDEYQDTNYIQERLVQILGGRERNIFVVGDDDQSIYRFRGATVANILQFQKHFGSSCRVITLHTNYRSGQGIVSFCMRWMAKPDWFSWERMGHLYRYRKGLLESGGGKESVPSVVRITAEEDDRLFEDRPFHRRADKKGLHIGLQPGGPAL